MGHDGRGGSKGDRPTVAGIAGGVGRRREAEDRRAVAADITQGHGDHRVGHGGGIGPIVDLGRRRGKGRGQCRSEAVKESLARSLDRGDAVARIILTEIEGQAAGDVAGADVIRIGVGAPGAPSLARTAGRQGGAAGVVDETSGGHRDVPVRRGERAGGRDGHGARATDQDVAGGAGGQAAGQGDIAAEYRDRSGDAQVGGDGQGGGVAGLTEGEATRGARDRKLLGADRRGEARPLRLDGHGARTEEADIVRGDPEDVTADGRRAGLRGLTDGQGATAGLKSDGFRYTT